MLESKAYEDSRYHAGILKNGMWGRGVREERQEGRFTLVQTFFFARVSIISQVRKGTQEL